MSKELALLAIALLRSIGLLVFRLLVVCLLVIRLFVVGLLVFWFLVVGLDACVGLLVAAGTPDAVIHLAGAAACTAGLGSRWLLPSVATHIQYESEDHQQSEEFTHCGTILSQSLVPASQSPWPQRPWLHMRLMHSLTIYSKKDLETPHTIGNCRGRKFREKCHKHRTSSE